ncbi:MAG TPA: bifunctional metallophosphatase/5'-nucleotidase, partial [Myxococcaceae bacterium]|nr:bifunctional metallophosphatase/5'-nucleotidase [Myxococcaceae bacterium]
MHRLSLLLVLAACAGTPPAPHPATGPVHVQLLALNDFHGNLEPPTGTIRLPDGTVPAGGGAWLAAHVARLRSEEPDSLVVGAGDLVGASPLASALTHDEPSIALMDALPLDVSCVGNHEFDEGLEELLRLQRGGCRTDESCKGPAFAGARFTYLAANVFDRTGKTILPATILKPVGGANIGFVGVVLRETPSVVTPSGVAGLTFGD